MRRIARAESNFNPKAKNPDSTAKGIYQILDGTWKYEGCTGNPYNASDNVDCAMRLYKRYGTTPWLSSSNNW